MTLPKLPNAGRINLAFKEAWLKEAELLQQKMEKIALHRCGGDDLEQMASRCNTIREMLK